MIFSNLEVIMLKLFKNLDKNLVKNQNSMFTSFIVWNLFCNLKMARQGIMDFDI